MTNYVTPALTYTTPCPSCGATITSFVGGVHWAICPACTFLGQVMMQPTPKPPQPYPGFAKQSMPGTPTPMTAAALLATIMMSDGDDDAPAPEPTDVDRWRDALRQHLYDLAASVAGAMREVSDADWRLPLERVYERVQSSHEALYRALGERRMGEYAPGRQALDAALVSALLWQVMLTHASERMRETSGR